MWFLKQLFHSRKLKYYSFGPKKGSSSCHVDTSYGWGMVLSRLANQRVTIPVSDVHHEGGLFLHTLWASSDGNGQWSVYDFTRRRRLVFFTFVWKFDHADVRPFVVT